MRFRHIVRRHLLVTWDVDPEQVARTLPKGFSPALAGGRALVSLASMRLSRGRAGPLPVLGWRQVNVRTYVTDRDGEPAVFFLLFRVTLAGLLELPFGVPVRSTWIRLGEGSVTARGLGVSLRFTVGDEPAQLPALDPPLGAHEVGYWRAAGLRRVVARHEPISWRRARLESGARIDPVLALGFDVVEPPACGYADGIEFSLERVEKVAPA